MTEQPHKIIAGSPDRPLVIGDIEIPCYVLEDEMRVLVQRGMLDSLKMARGTGRGVGDRLADFLGGKRISPFVSDDLRLVIEKPILFKPKDGGAVGYGYPATALTDICNAVLKARQEGTLEVRQRRIAEQCEMLIRGMAHVGIIALVDEATGYQEVRSRRALAKILERYLAKELQAWTKTFQKISTKKSFVCGGGLIRHWRREGHQRGPALLGDIQSILSTNALPPAYGKN